MAKFSSLAALLKNASPDFLELNGFVRKPSRSAQERRKTKKQATGLELQFLYFWRLCGGCCEVDDRQITVASLMYSRG